MFLTTKINFAVFIINMTIIAGSWLVRCIKALLSQRRRRQHLPSSMGTYTLPPELTLLVVAHLDTLSATSLSLTCRRLNRPCFPRRHRLNTAEKTTLLLWLEKENATMYFCHFCVKLHPWDKKMETPEYLYRKQRSCPEDYRDHMSLLSALPYTPYYMMRLVMNRHFYGPSHGLPLSILQQKVRKRAPFSGWSRQEELDARIIDNSLLTFSVNTYSSVHGNAQTFRRNLDLYSGDPCRHLTTRSVPSYACTRLPELPADDAPSDFLAPCEPTFRSCPWCMTDYCIEINRKGKRKDYVIKLSVWREIGDCRCPSDWSWRNVTRCLSTYKMRVDHPLGYRPGFVRDKWCAVDGVSVGNAGEWVDIPNMAEWKERIVYPEESW